MHAMHAPKIMVFLKLCIIPYMTKKALPWNIRTKIYNFSQAFIVYQYFIVNVFTRSGDEMKNFYEVQFSFTVSTPNLRPLGRGV